MPVEDPSELYGLPLDRFVAERTELVKVLRKAGRRDEAAEVAALRKPSVAAWAVNQLTRSRSEAVRDLFAAGNDLVDAQGALLEGRGDGAVLRDAARREREAVDGLVRAARGLLSTDGHELAPGTLERVAETLHAAALDEDARAQVSDGLLTRELRHVGLGPAALATAQPAPRPSRRARTETPPERRRGQPGRDVGTAQEREQAREAERERRADEERAARERARRVKEARSAESDARRAAARAAHELEQAEARRERAADALREADAVLAAARARAREADERHDAARQALEAL